MPSRIHEATFRVRVLRRVQAEQDQAVSVEHILEAGAAVAERLHVPGRHHQETLALDELGAVQVCAQPGGQLTRRRGAVCFDALDDGQRGRARLIDVKRPTPRLQLRGAGSHFQKAACGQHCRRRSFVEQVATDSTAARHRRVTQRPERRTSWRRGSCSLVWAI